MGGEPSPVRAAPTSAPAGWQAQKSAATRRRIVEAAIRCFVELGYAQTTTTAIADRAGLSRGAMLHHFPSKGDVVRAAVEHLQRKRLKALRKSMQRLAPATDERVRAALAAYWAHVRQPMFAAFFELAVAARTDRVLAAILRSADEAVQRQWDRTAREAFAQWQVRAEQFDLALDQSRYVMEGLAVSLLSRPQTERDRRLLRHLEDTLRALLGG